MRRRKTFIVLLLALACGGLAGYSALRLLQQQTRPILPQRTSTTQIVVAARDLEPGALLGQEDVRVLDWPSSTVPEGYARTIPDVVGRGVIAPIRLNEPLLDSKLGDRAGGAGLPIVIPEGMRAVSVNVNEVITVSGFVTPGTRADLMLTMVNPATNEQTTKTIMQNVTALAADKVVTQDAAGKPLTYGVLTVLLTPEDAEKLVLASSKGSIQLALRNRIDVKEIQSDGARADRLFAGGGGAPRATGTRPRAVVPAPQAEERNGRTGMIEVYKGGVKTLIHF